jgi:hypothetical protein
MSLSKEIAHDLRTINTQPADIAVLPQWAKALPVAFYLAFTFFLLGIAYNTFNTNLQDARKNELTRAVDQYRELASIDKQTMTRLIHQRNTAVRVARWVDYSPMIQELIMGLLSPLGDRVQVTQIRLDRREGILPEYTMDFAFKASQGDVNSVIEAVRTGLYNNRWQLTTIAQVEQEGLIRFQGYLQPAPGAMSFESQYLSVLQDPNQPVPAAPTGVAR